MLRSAYSRSWNIFLSAFCMTSDFASEPSSSIVLLCWQGITHAIFVTALDKAILLRQYAISLKKSGTRVCLPPGCAFCFLIWLCTLASVRLLRVPSCTPWRMFEWHMQANFALDRKGGRVLNTAACRV